MFRVRSKPQAAAAVSCAAASLWMVVYLVPGEVMTPSGADQISRPAPFERSPQRAEADQGSRPHSGAVRLEVQLTAPPAAPSFAERVERLCVLLSLIHI